MLYPMCPPKTMLSLASTFRLSRQSKSNLGAVHRNTSPFYPPPFITTVLAIVTAMILKGVICMVPI
eukprot:747394-Hanusia_phi.AAC.2